MDWESPIGDLSECYSSLFAWLLLNCCNRLQWQDRCRSIRIWYESHRSGNRPNDWGLGSPTESSRYVMLSRAAFATRRFSLLEPSVNLPKAGSLDVLDWGMPPRQQCESRPAFLIYPISLTQSILPAIGEQWDWGILPNQSGKNSMSLHYVTLQMIRSHCSRGFIVELPARPGLGRTPRARG
jgi:hypothetical protein